ncbi:MAG: autotransporter-associated beta strand repeat-containing protein [Akkermansiaceae bacterium]|nr:autotransporter-associated beta strand repeat-containing protein [Akkermansiaceae bacterium]
MKVTILATSILFAGLAPGLAAPYNWTGAAADNDFFNEANWTDNGGAVAGDIFTTATGMLGGAGDYTITGADFSAGLAGGVLWDAGANVIFTNTSGRFTGIFRSLASTSLTFDNSDLFINGLAEWGANNDYQNESGPFATQWTASLANGSDVVSSNNGIDPNVGIWFGDLTVSDSSTLGAQSLSSTYVTLAGATSQLTLNGGGNPINNSVVNLTEVGASVRFNAETVATVLAEHLYGNSSDQPESGILIGGQLVGFAGMIATDLDGSGNHTNANGVGFNLVTDGASGAILTVTALPPAGDALTFTNASGYWSFNYDDDWNNGVSNVNFFDGDLVTFNDSAAGFPGTINVTLDKIGGPIVPGAIIVNNSAGNNYVFDMAASTSELFGNAPLTKDGDGTLTIVPADSNTPYGGVMTINGGAIEQANLSTPLQNSTVVVNPGGTYRLLPSVNSQDVRMPRMILAGGTLDHQRRAFHYRPITLAAGTTSTINVTLSNASDGFWTWAGPNDGALSGSGNLIKTGPGPFTVSGRSVTYTGTTTIEEGSIVVANNRTAASPVWNIESGALALNNDSVTPIENLSNSAAVNLTGGKFDVTNNTETIGTLAMDSSSTFTTLAVANNGAGTTTASLTVGTLDLTGTLNFVQFSSTPGLGTYELMNATTVNGTLGTNLLVAGVPPSAQSWSFSGGVVSVTIGAYAGNTITYTNLSGDAMWTQALDNDWTDGSPIGYYDTDAVTFGDAATGLPGTLSVAISSTVTPSSVTLNNSLGNDYTFTGSSIAGTGGLTKNGTGTVTLAQQNTYTGATIINDGTVVLAAGGSDVIADGSAITINSGATLDLAAGNAIQRNSSAGSITIDGGLLTQSDGNHGHYPNLNLSNGASITATSAGSFGGVNVDFDGDVTVSGTSPSTLGPFTFGFRFNNFSPVFNVSDVTSDSAVDLTIDSRIRGNSGFTKTGAGTMYIAANPNSDTDYTTTTVAAGCLLIEDLSSIPADLTQVSVGDAACFGGIVGGSNLGEAALLAIAANVVWDAGGNARLMIDTDGQTVDIAAELAGNFKIIATGGGTLNLNGGAGVNDILTEGGTTVNVASTGATTITVGNITTTAGTTPGTTKATLTFTADGPVDVYASDDLATWGTPVLTGVSSSPVVIDNLAGGRKFFVLVSAGAAYPPAP